MKDIIIHDKELAKEPFEAIVIGTIFIGTEEFADKAFIKVNEHVKIYKDNSNKKDLIIPLMHSCYNAINLETGEDVFIFPKSEVILTNSKIDIYLKG